MSSSQLGVILDFDDHDAFAGHELGGSPVTRAGALASPRRGLPRSRNDLAPGGLLFVVDLDLRRRLREFGRAFAFVRGIPTIPS